LQSTAHLPKFYKKEIVYKIWKDTITYSVEFIDPVYFTTENEYNIAISTMEKEINLQKARIEKGQFFLLPINFDTFDQAPYITQCEMAASYGHEVRMFQKIHRRCIKCQGVSTVKEYLKMRCDKDAYHCSQCRQLSSDYFWKKDCDMFLPIWFNEKNEVQYEIPEELQNLRLGEQLLIQRLSCFIPVVHIKNGMMRLHGHCVCFRQDIVEICNSLPRTRVNAIKIVKTYKNMDSVGIQDFDVFVIRRDVVLKALRWLKRFHKWYRDDPDLVIQEENLDWMGGKQTASLIGTEAETDNLIEIKEFDTLQREEDDMNHGGKS